jgi:hypothetical protein
VFKERLSAFGNRLLWDVYGAWFNGPHCKRVFTPGGQASQAQISKPLIQREQVEDREWHATCINWGALLRLGLQKSPRRSLK